MATSILKYSLGEHLEYAVVNIDLSTRSWAQSGQGMYYCTGYEFSHAKQIVAVSLINWSGRKPKLIIPYIYTPNPKVINLMAESNVDVTTGQLGVGVLYYR